MPSVGISKWGFPKYTGKGSIINTRAETASQKPTFRTSLLNNRCAALSTGFYEWSAEKKKFLFTLPEPILYLGGIYKVINGESCFVILTTKANGSIVDVHERMPVIIKDDKLAAWVSDTDWALNYLNELMPMLQRCC